MFPLVFAVMVYYIKSMTDAMTNADFTVTDSAVDRIATLMEQGGGGVFRVAVNGGGCSGFQYAFSLDGGDTTTEDTVLNLTDSRGRMVTVAVDSMSLEFLGGSQLDFVTELIGSYFQVSNPNATASCGCGTSFAI